MICFKHFRIALCGSSPIVICTMVVFTFMLIYQVSDAPILSTSYLTQYKFSVSDQKLYCVDSESAALRHRTDPFLILFVRIVFMRYLPLQRNKIFKKTLSHNFLPKFYREFYKLQTKEHLKHRNMLLFLNIKSETAEQLKTVRQVKHPRMIGI